MALRPAPLHLTRPLRSRAVTATATTAEPRVMVRCAVCTIAFDVSARLSRDIAAGRVEPRCRIHKRGARPRQTKMAKNRRMWLDRFSMDEIRFMAWAITPRGLSDRQATEAALAASAAPPSRDG